MNNQILNEQNNQNECLDFDACIEEDGAVFSLLPEGDYTFTVTNVERGRFPGGAKIPPCNKAVLTLKVTTDNGLVATVHTDLILHRSLEWKLSSFFRSVGMKKQGERIVMDWNAVIGAQGRAHVTVRSYTNKFGQERKVNDIEKFYDYNPASFTPVRSDFDGTDDDGYDTF